jgi:magnesium transporter
MEDYDGSLFVVLRTTHYDDEREEVEFGEIDVFVGVGYVITVRHGRASELGLARRRLESRPELLELGPAAVVWAIIDKVVDDYQPVVDGIDNDIGEVETEIFDQGADATQRIYFLKREVIEFHHAVAPLLAPLEGLHYGARPQVPDELRKYFRDIYDHARRVDEQVTGQRELLTSILEANLALLGVQQNQVVRAISAWAAIIAVPTFLASIWGMNFEYMPELDERWGYPVALATMAVAVIFLYRFFKRIEWL